jgi:CheY-like chemotaxis protein
MMDKERLLAVSGLDLAGNIENMDDNRLNEYMLAVHRFEDCFSECEKNLKDALDARDKDSVVNILSSAQKLLHDILATKLADECLRFINILKTDGLEKVESGLSGFLSAVSALSIDMQMAELKGADASADTSAPEDNPTEKLILAVDDTALFLNTLKLLLQSVPQYKLTCVTSGDAALRFVEKHTPDLLILDIDMPKMDGFTLARKLKEKGLTAPIIFLTGNSSREYVIQAVKVGGSDFIVKPIEKEQVLTKITKYI